MPHFFPIMVSRLPPLLYHPDFLSHCQVHKTHRSSKVFCAVFQQQVRIYSRYLNNQENIILDSIVLENIFPLNQGGNMLDAISLEILNILQKKARIPNVEVSRQVGLAPSAVLERIRKMEKQGIIDGYEVRLNPEQFNRAQVAFVHIKTNPAMSDKVGNELSLIPEIQEVHFVSGSDCYLVKIRSADTTALGQLLQEKITTIDGVLSTSTETVLSTVKETSRIPLPLTISQTT
jgi:Lrp/AsnC family leucine-responsive transcriptional regulator